MQKEFSKRGLGLVLILVFLLSGCEKTAPKTYPFNYSASVMGTSFSIKVTHLPEGVSVAQLQELIQDRLTLINQSMSTYLNDSELSLLNHADSKVAQTVSLELFKVLAAAQEISQLSGGAFDITVGALVNLWGFGPDVMRYQTPDAQAIKQLLANSGYQNLVLDASAKTVTKKIAGLTMDLSALAKGYAVDAVAELLEAQGIADYLVEIGGELRLKGVNLQGKRWRIAIEKPNSAKRELQKVLPITDKAMATSGDYRNFFEQNGQRFSHTIDPRTGYPITHKLASVTILSDTCMQADAWATALMVLGPDVGYQTAVQQKIAAFFIIKTDQGFVEHATPLFLELTKG